MDPDATKLSALVITYNEIGYIERCIDSISFADEIIVVDSYSTDGTYEYLLAHPRVKVIQHPFDNFTAQKSFALEQASNDWVLFTDADEVVTDTLRDEILAVINSNTDIVAFWFYRQFMFQDEKLRYSGWQTDKNYRLFRKSKVAFSQRRLVHETLDVDGKTGILKEKLVHYCYRDYDNYKGKMLKYGRLKGMEDFRVQRRFPYPAKLVKPAWKFFHHYVVRLGFLDGKKGYTISKLDALAELERCRERERLENTKEG